MPRQYKRISLFFVIAALYDGVFGLIFLIKPFAVFEWAEIAPPNHAGYVQFPAALLLLFAIMFLMIALRPKANRSLILYGIGLKVSYVAVAGGHWLSGGIPTLWKPVVIADALFAILFLWAYLVLLTAREEDTSAKQA